MVALYLPCLANLIGLNFLFHIFNHGKKQMEKIKISKDSPAENNQATHLQPDIDFLIKQGNIPLSLKFTRDKGGIGTFEFTEPIDSDLLKERFEFPDTMQVGYSHYYGGALWDERNALVIHQG